MGATDLSMATLILGRGCSGGSWCRREGAVFFWSGLIFHFYIISTGLVSAVATFITKKGTQRKPFTQSRNNMRFDVKFAKAIKTGLPGDHNAPIFQEGTSAVAFLIISS